MKLSVCLALGVLVAGCSKRDDKPAPSDPPKPTTDTTTPTTAPPSTPPPTTPPPAASAAPPCKDDANKHVNNGVLADCILAADHPVGELTCTANKMAYFFPSGKLKECSLTAPVTLAGFSCKDQTRLYEDGALRRCKLEADREYGGVAFVKGEWVSLYPDGTLHRAEVKTRTATIEGHPCTGYLNYFHKNGKLKKCELAEDKEVAGKKVAKGTSICFDDTGAPVDDCKKLDWTDLVD